MTALTFRSALLGAVAGAALSCGVAADPAQAIPLLDNTDRGNASSAGSRLTNVGAVRALSLNVSTNTRVASRFSLTTNLTADPGPKSLTLRIFKVATTTSQANLAATPNFSYNFAYAGTGDPTNYSFRFDAPLEASSVYAFVFSDPTNGGASINGSSQAFAPGTPYTNGSSFRTFDNGGTWTPTGAPYFYLDEVPGPLPLLGAGTAFAWSRRLRRRVNSAQAKKPATLHHGEA